MRKEPLGERAKARKQCMITSKWWRTMCGRKWREVEPAPFTKHLLEVHQEWEYPKIPNRCFTIPRDFEHRMMAAIGKGKNNKAVGTDGIQTEMLKAEQKLCASFLTAWWSTVGRLGIFPRN